MKTRTAGVTTVRQGGVTPVEKFNMDTMPIDGFFNDPAQKKGFTGSRSPSIVPEPEQKKGTNIAKADETADELSKSRSASAISGATLAVADIMNAYVNYTSRSEAAKTNITLAEQDFNSILSSGREASFSEEMKGRARGENALLGAALQGQDVRGAFAQQLQNQEETFGIMKALTVEVNALRQAHGVRQEIVLQEAEMDAARRDFHMQTLNATVRGVTSLGGGLDTKRGNK